MLESLGNLSVRVGRVGTVAGTGNGREDDGSVARAEAVGARGTSSGALMRRIRLGGTGVSACLIGKCSACGEVAALEGGE